MLYSKYNTCTHVLLISALQKQILLHSWAWREQHGPGRASILKGWLAVITAVPLLVFCMRSKHFAPENWPPAAPQPYASSTFTPSPCVLLQSYDTMNNLLLGLLFDDLRWINKYNRKAHGLLPKCFSKSICSLRYRWLSNSSFSFPITL